MLIAAKTAPRPTASGRGRPHTTFDGIDDVCYAFGWILSCLFIVFFPVGILTANVCTRSVEFPFLILIFEGFGCSIGVSGMYYLVPVSLFFALVDWACRQNLSLAQKLLVAFPERGTDNIEVNEYAVLALVGFVVHFLICLCLYKFLYTSSGTTNPGWTAVFG